MSELHSSKDNPCLQCGACCASFRVSFYWAETDATGLTESLTEKVNDFYSCMRGTNHSSPRCVALIGAIGGKTTCSVYSMRPSPCREVQAGEEKCNRARLRHGLAPIGAQDAVLELS